MTKWPTFTDLGRRAVIVILVMALARFCRPGRTALSRGRQSDPQST